MLFGIFIERLTVAISSDLAVIVPVGVVGSTRRGRKSSSSKPTKKHEQPISTFCKSTNYGIVITQ